MLALLLHSMVARGFNPSATKSLLVLACAVPLSPYARQPAKLMLLIYGCISLTCKVASMMTSTVALGRASRSMWPGSGHIPHFHRTLQHSHWPALWYPHASAAHEGNSSCGSSTTGLRGAGDHGGRHLR